MNVNNKQWMLLNEVKLYFSNIFWSLYSNNNNISIEFLSVSVPGSAFYLISDLQSIPAHLAQGLHLA